MRLSWIKLKSLLPWYRRARERDMEEELKSLFAIADPGELGNVTRAAEEARAVWSWIWLEELYRDAQYAWRTLRHNPGFTATAVLSLALGIGANTAIFGLIDALMLRSLPVRDPQELVQLKMRSPRGGAMAGETFSYAIVNALAERKDIFQSVGGSNSTSFDVGPRGSMERVSGDWVTGDYYEALGLNAARGRLLGREDDRPGAPLAAVISYGYWERQFGSDPEVTGKTVTVDGVPVTIAGVSPRGFAGANVGAGADIAMAAAALPRLKPSAAGLLNPGNFWLRILARPQRGVSISQAKAHLAVVWPQISERVISTAWPAAQRKEMAESTFDLDAGGTGYSYLRQLFRRPLMVLMAVSGLVLLIACANVASLLLARAAARQREISIRLAIGAGRGRVIRQLLTESTLLSSLGAGLGICLAWLTSRSLVDTLRSGPYPVVFDLTPNWHVLGFASAVAMANGVVFGLAPAFHTTAMRRPGAVRGDGRVTQQGSRLLSSLVSAQVALSLLLLVGAGLFMRTLQNLVSADPGFRREGVLLVDLDGRHEGYRDAALTAFYGDLLARVRRLPGVTAASISSHTPLNGSTWSEAVALKGQPIPARDNAILIAAGPNFFATMQTPLIAGREFDARDQGSFRVAIVNQTFAARFFPGRNPIGEYLSATVSRPASDLQIVGVVKDASTGSLRGISRPTVYVSYFERPVREGSLEIRAAGPLSQAAAAIRKELQPSFPNTPIEVRALNEQVERTLVQERLMARLAGGFGALGLVLACVGLYGLLAYSVARRTKEIGIRMALGAARSGVVWMVGRRALGLVGMGIAVGLPAAWLMSRSVQSMLFGLKATDPEVVAGAVMLLGAAGVAAAYFPATRAARVDPMTALREE
uniref:Permease n=1 Tax=Solibacter usitatus (strain Ellin6076) TaxID=234267 RepID=Q01N82_SOLUE